MNKYEKRRRCEFWAGVIMCVVAAFVGGVIGVSIGQALEERDKEYIDYYWEEPSDWQVGSEHELKLKDK